MKKTLFLLLFSVILAGCAAEETFETVADAWVTGTAAPMAEVVLALPEEAAVPVSESDDGVLYQCQGYEAFLQTLSAGDLDATVRAVTGYGKEDLTIIGTRTEDVKRYDLVWSCMGEAGDQVCRACILDDGNYHYVLTVLAEADRAGEFEDAWEELFSSYSLS